MVCLSVHASMRTAILRRSVCSLTLNRVLLAVGRETSGPASALRAPAGSGSDMTYRKCRIGAFPARNANGAAMLDRSRQRAGAVQA